MHKYDTNKGTYKQKKKITRSFFSENIDRIGMLPQLVDRYHENTVKIRI